MSEFVCEYENSSNRATKRVYIKFPKMGTYMAFHSYSTIKEIEAEIKVYLHKEVDKIKVKKLKK